MLPPDNHNSLSRSAFALHPARDTVVILLLQAAGFPRLANFMRWNFFSNFSCNVVDKWHGAGPSSPGLNRKTIRTLPEIWAIFFSLSETVY